MNINLKKDLEYYKWNELQDYKIIDVSQYWDQFKIFLNSNKGKKYIKIFKQIMKFRLPKRSLKYLNTDEALEYIKNIDEDWHNLYKLSIIDKSSIKVYNTIKKHTKQDKDHWSNVICIDSCHFINTILLFPYLLNVYGKENIKHIESCMHTVVINIERKEIYDISSSDFIYDKGEIQDFYDYLFKNYSFSIRNEEQLKKFFERKDILIDWLMAGASECVEVYDFREYFLQNYLC